jgi:peptidoglycan/xylan/chitin deacetylase (PgdA/CDA1 family)
MMSVAEQAKRVTKRVLIESGVSRALGRLTPPCAVLLTYHSVQPEPDPLARLIGPGISHSERDFDQQMQTIARHFAPVTLEQVQHFLEGKRELPRRAVAVTFDDGFRDNYELAAPILARHGIPAAFYMTVGCLGIGRAPWFCRLRYAFVVAPPRLWTDPWEGRGWDLGQAEARAQARLAALERCATLVGEAQSRLVAAIEHGLEITPAPEFDHLMLDWEQVAALHRAGHVVGSHTMTHPNLAHVTLDDAREELRQSKQILEQRLGTTIKHFSYPYPILSPNWNAQTRALTAELGYETAVICDAQAARAGQDPLAIPRVSAPMEQEDFRWALEANFFGHRV